MATRQIAFDPATETYVWSKGENLLFLAENSFAEIWKIVNKFNIDKWQLSPLKLSLWRDGVKYDLNLEPYDTTPTYATVVRKLNKFLSNSFNAPAA